MLAIPSSINVHKVSKVYYLVVSARLYGYFIRGIDDVYFI